MTRELVVKGIYRHFKNLYYCVESVAKHSETEEDYVVYRKMYGDKGRWIREKQMFLSEVDREKYPEISQQYRFEYLRLQSERIFLRPWEDGDASRLFELASDPDIGRRAGWKPHESAEESLSIIQNVFRNDSTWAIVLKESGDVIGAMGYGPSCDCGLPAVGDEPTVGYWVGKPYWNQGYCTEALKLMLDYMREQDQCKSVISGHFVDNPASGRVMEKCGFVATGEECLCPELYGSEECPVRVLRLNGLGFRG